MNKKPILLALIAFLIIYGSLYPFTFAQPTASILDTLLKSEWSDGSLGDILGNVGLFVPWGLMGMLTLERRRGLAVTLFGGLVLAFGLQLAQVWVPSRIPALYDGIWNMLGCLIGMVVAVFVHQHATLFARHAGRDHVPLWLLSTWIVIEWLPLVPSLDLQLVKNQLKGLLAVDLLDLGGLALRLSISLLFGELLARRFGARLSALLLPLVVGAMFVGKLLLVDTTLTASAATGHIVGILAWWLLVPSPAEKRSLVVISALLAAYSLQALMPFEFREHSSNFDFLPFAGSLQGSMLVNARSLGGSLLLFASILLLLRDTGSKTPVATIGLSLWVLLLESLQLFIATRSASITEPLLVLIGGILVGAITSLKGLESPTAPLARPIHEDLRASTAATTPVRMPLWAGTVLLLLMVGGLKALLAVPSIPYNVHELFRGNGNVAALTAFSLALIWVGAGSAWVGNRLVRASRPALLFAPLTAIVALVSLLLLWSSVSSESISDIVGASNRYWFVINKNVWGDVWRKLFLQIGEPSAINFLETCVRYWAIYTPLMTALVLATYALDQGAGVRQSTRAHGALAAAALVICAGLVLWLCKAIAFDWSSTDNLNELIAREGELGLGGGGYLYALLGILAINAVLLARMSPAKPGKMLLTVLYSALALPFGWWLLNQGLEPKVEKYGNVFSGVQFLLGPDRSHLLPKSQLLLRWCALQVMGTLIIGLGLRLGRSVWPCSKDESR